MHKLFVWPLNPPPPRADPGRGRGRVQADPDRERGTPQINGPLARGPAHRRRCGGVGAGSRGCVALHVPRRGTIAAKRGAAPPTHALDHRPPAPMHRGLRFGNRSAPPNSSQRPKAPVPHCTGPRAGACSDQACGNCYAHGCVRLCTHGPGG